MASRRRPASRLVLKGILSVRGSQLTLDVGSESVALKIPRTKNKLNLQGGRLYYVRGIQSGRTVTVTGIRLADRTLPSGACEDHSRFSKIMAVLTQHRSELLKLSGVLDARAGYRYVNGWTTHTPAIVITYDGSQMPPSVSDPFKGVPVDLRPATPVEQLSASQSLTPQWVRDALNVEPLAVPGWELREQEGPLSAALQFSTANTPQLKYVAPPGVSLDKLKDKFELTCHSSPDSGWSQLQPFLSEVQKVLTIAMYDFTAPHIAKELVGLHQLKALTLVLDPGEALSSPGTSKSSNPKALDQHEVTIVHSLQHSFAKRLSFCWAAVKRAGKTQQGIFPTAYHIKVAVTDSKAVWLSSGNWQSSNQPDIGALTPATPSLPQIFQKYNREWHVIARNPKLAKLLETFILWDRSQALKVQVHPLSLNMPDVPLVDDVSLAAAQPQVHPPQKFTGRFTIQPLLTPDNYLEHLTKLVQGAQNSLRIQNQYIKLPARGGDEFIGFLELLRDKAKQFKTNFRVIVRNLPGVQEQLEALEHFGFDMNQFKRQTNTHTKGVIVDDQTVLVGSHNWSNQGVLENRDASLIVYDRKVAQFYATLFDHDWQVLAHQTGAAGAATMPATSLNWSEYLS